MNWVWYKRTSSSDLHKWLKMNTRKLTGLLFLAFVFLTIMSGVAHLKKFSVPLQCLLDVQTDSYNIIFQYVQRLNLTCNDISPREYNTSPMCILRHSQLGKTSSERISSESTSSETSKSTLNTIQGLLRDSVERNCGTLGAPAPRRLSKKRSEKNFLKCWCHFISHTIE
ncbi:hypothetical protein SRHO_G00290410 [Serrasalmus rhombeus]